MESLLINKYLNLFYIFFSAEIIILIIIYYFIFRLIRNKMIHIFCFITLILFLYYNFYGSYNLPFTKNNFIRNGLNQLHYEETVEWNNYSEILIEYKSFLKILDYNSNDTEIIDTYIKKAIPRTKYKIKICENIKKYITTKDSKYLYQAQKIYYSNDFKITCNYNNNPDNFVANIMIPEIYNTNKYPPGLLEDWFKDEIKKSEK